MFAFIVLIIAAQKKNTILFKTWGLLEQLLKFSFCYFSGSSYRAKKKVWARCLAYGKEYERVINEFILVKTFLRIIANVAACTNFSM